MSETLTPELARAMLAQERQTRMETCGKEIDAALQKHGCQLVAMPALTPDGRVVAQVQVVARE